jgi:uncharacterized protein YciI
MSLQFLVEYNYIDGITEKAHDTRDAHMAYRESIDSRIILAGPIVGKDDKPAGSMMIIQAIDAEEAEKVANEEPFVAAGVSEVVSVRLMRVSVLNKI